MNISYSKLMTTSLSLVCLLGMMVTELYAQVEVPVGSSNIVTPRGIKAIDRWPVPRVKEFKGAPEVRVKALKLAPLDQTFLLHSRPGASKVIYMDFDGQLGNEPDPWDPAGDYYIPYNFEGDGSTFSDNERTEIQKAWQSLSEEFLPFDVDVTTEDPGVEALRNTGSGDTNWGQRVVITSGSLYGYSWAYVDDFAGNVDMEAYVEVVGVTACAGRNVADYAAHEVGHTVGLSHDGQIGGEEYYEGHGPLPRDSRYWSPTMGWSYFEGVSQWSKGEYTNASNFSSGNPTSSNEDDLLIITTHNGFGYRPDDHGSSTSTATALEFDTDTLALVAEGIIERNTDLDYFAFTVPTSDNIQFVINPDDLAPNLNILAVIHDAAGAAINTSDSQTSLGASFDVTLGPGIYYLSVDGTGFDDPSSDGYTDYGSLGYFSIEALGCTSADYDSDGLSNVNDPDDDNDGRSDVDEDTAGTLSRDKSSYLWVDVDLTADPTVKSLSFPGSTGRSFRLQSRESLTTGSWGYAGTSVPGANGKMSILVTNALTHSFYRVEATKP